MTAPERLTEQLDAALANYTAGIDRAVRFVTIDQVDMLAEFYLQNRRADLAAVQPDPRDEVLNQAMKDAITMGEGWIRTLQDGTLQLIDPSAVRLMPDATDPRDEVIARLVEALEWQRDQPEAHPFMKLQADAAFAAAKELMK